MFSVIFPGQGSQIVGMGKEFHDKFDLVKNLFKEADETLGFHLSKLILEGPKDELDLTVNTQPAVFLTSYSIFNVVKNEFNIDLNKAKYLAGHSLGEYSALCAAGALSLADTALRTADSGYLTRRLADVAQDVSCPASARVSAARTVLELALKGVELEDLAVRVEELESQVAGV